MNIVWSGTADDNVKATLKFPVIIQIADVVKCGHVTFSIFKPIKTIKPFQLTFPNKKNGMVQTRKPLGPIKVIVFSDRFFLTTVPMYTVSMTDENSP